MSLYFPIGDDEGLRSQFKMLDMNSLRMGKIFEVIDMLTLDSCHSYVRSMADTQGIFFTSVAMGDLQFK